MFFIPLKTTEFYGFANAILLKNIFGVNLEREREREREYISLITLLRNSLFMWAMIPPLLNVSNKRYFGMVFN